MAAKLSSRQRQYIRKHTKEVELDPSEQAGELNIIPFLDIVVNLIMFLLMTTAAFAFFAQIEAQLPEYKKGVGSRGAKKEVALNLNVTITASGAIVTGSEGKLAPGCNNTETGRVITVPTHSDGTYDWPSLTSCIERVKERFPDEDQVIVSADPLVEYEHIISAMDSIRSNGKEDMFPNVLLSAGVR